MTGLPRNSERRRVACGPVGSSKSGAGVPAARMEGSDSGITHRAYARCAWSVYRSRTAIVEQSLTYSWRPIFHRQYAKTALSRHSERSEESGTEYQLRATFVFHADPSEYLRACP